MRALFRVFIAVGSVAAAITGTIVAVKKNTACGRLYDQIMPESVKTSFKWAETKSVSGYKKTVDSTIEKVRRMHAVKDVSKSDDAKGPAQRENSLFDWATAKKLAEFRAKSAAKN
jgi:hypothetical protein